MHFTVKLMNGDIIPISIDMNINLCVIYKGVYDCLPEEIKNNIDVFNMRLFSFNNDSIDSLYSDIVNGEMIGCFINEYRVEIDYDDNNEYFMDTYGRPFSHIGIRIIKNKDTIYPILCVFACDNKFFYAHDIMVTGRGGHNLSEYYIETLYSPYNSIHELISSSSNHGDIADLISDCVQKEYDNFVSGDIPKYNEEERWYILSSDK